MAQATTQRSVGVDEQEDVLRRLARRLTELEGDVYGQHCDVIMVICSRYVVLYLPAG